MRLRRIAGDAAPVELLLVMHALLAGTLDLNALRALAGPIADAADAQLAAFDAYALSDAEQQKVPAAIWTQWCAQYGAHVSALAPALKREASARQTGRASRRARVWQYV